MKISTKGRYALRLLMDLANTQSSGPVPLGVVARRLDISEKYLWQVADLLKRAGVLYAVSGPQGGYALAKKVESITLHDILQAVETDGDLVACLRNPDLCRKSAVCPARQVWRQMQSAVSGAAQNMTLAAIINHGRDETSTNKKGTI